VAEPLPDVASLARRLADAFDSSGIPYAIGGALAYGQWAIPRGTVDVDITAFLPEAEWARALDSLQSCGAVFEAGSALSELRERGACRVSCLGFFVDLFVPSIPFYASVQSRAVARPLLGRPARFLTAEDLAVFKMLFFRPKDLVDVRYLLAARGAALDRAYVRRWLVEMVGEADERIVRWDALSSEVPPQS
jgi:hypothetical protein